MFHLSEVVMITIKLIVLHDTQQDKSQLVLRSFRILLFSGYLQVGRSIGDGVEEFR